MIITQRVDKKTRMVHLRSDAESHTDKISELQGSSNLEKAAKAVRAESPGADISGAPRLVFVDRETGEIARHGTPMEACEPELQCEFVMSGLANG